MTPLQSRRKNILEFYSNQEEKELGKRRGRGRDEGGRKRAEKEGRGMKRETNEKIGKNGVERELRRGG